MPQTGPVELLRRAVRTDPSRPFVTFYDDATGERVELSVKTFDNWVAKTANFLVDGLDAQPGTPVVLALPPHWQTAVWLFACWSAGLVTVPVEMGTGAAGTTDAGSGEAGIDEAVAVAVEPEGTDAPYILVTTEDRLPGLGQATTGAAEEVVGLSLHALGAPLSQCPPGVVDYAAEVRSYGDRFVPGAPVGPEDPSAVMMKITFSGADLVRQCGEFATEVGLDSGARVLSDMSYATTEGLFAGLLGPMSAGGSVIICRNLAKSQLDRRITLEHVTAIAGVSGWVEPSGSVHRLI